MEGERGGGSEAYRRDQRAADRQQDRRRADASHLRLQGGSDSPGAAGGPAGSGKRGVAGENYPWLGPDRRLYRAVVRDAGSEEQIKSSRVAVGGGLVPSPRPSPQGEGENHATGREGSPMSALPSPEYSRNMRLIGHSDQGGRPDGVQLMVHRGFAYIGHMVSQGFSVVDVRDPTRPTTVNYIAAPPGTWNVHLQAHDDLLLVINARDLFADARFADEKVYYTRSVGDTVSDVQDKGWSAGLRIFDISTPALPLPDRDLLVVLDEAVLDNQEDGEKLIWLFDIREPTNPVSIATFPPPDEADYVAKGAHFGPHNLHENRPGSFVSSTLIFATYQNAGVRAYDISNPYRPLEIGALVPAAPERMMDTRPGRPRVIQSCDVFVDAQGIIYSTDYNGGLSVIEYLG
ncbi:unnamed protein product [Klebsiella pneumoniae]|nr:unnamed protein product [Klebsiella pneumoniae]